MSGTLTFANIFLLIPAKTISSPFGKIHLVFYIFQDELKSSFQLDSSSYTTVSIKETMIKLLIVYRLIQQKKLHLNTNLHFPYTHKLLQQTNSPFFIDTQEVSPVSLPRIFN